MLSRLEICEKVATCYGLSVAELRAPGKEHPAVSARQIAMYLMRVHLHESWHRIANFFTRDHSTAIHAYFRVLKEIEKDRQVRAFIDSFGPPPQGTLFRPRTKGSTLTLPTLKQRNEL